jgi:hypothetical protein
VVRDDHGRAIWRRPGLDATLGELLDAAEHGLIDGDPLQPYLIPSVPQGDAGGLDAWINFKDALLIFWSIANAAATAHGALGLRDRLAEVRRRRRPELTDVVQQYAPGWSERGAAPSDLRQLLASCPRSSAEIASLLGCSTREAEALLWGLGFTFDAVASVWHERGDPTAQLIADDIALSAHSRVTALGDTQLLRGLAKARLDRFLTSGELPALQDAWRTLDEHQLDGLGAAPAEEDERQPESDQPGPR